MGKSLDVVNRFYNITNNKNTTDGLDDLLVDNMKFSGPLIESNGAKNYIEMIGPFLKSHKSWKMLKQFEDDKDVCSIYELILSTPDGKSFSVVIADWIKTNSGKIVEQKIYYDPREFARSFGIS